MTSRNVGPGAGGPPNPRMSAPPLKMPFLPYNTTARTSATGSSSSILAERAATTSPRSAFTGGVSMASSARPSRTASRVSALIAREREPGASLEKGGRLSSSRRGDARHAGTGSAGHQRSRYRLDLRESRAGARADLPSMNVINFAQGEMAMLTTFVAWQLVQDGMPMWVAFAITLAIAFAGAVALERAVIRPV